MIYFFRLLLLICSSTLIFAVPPKELEEQSPHERLLFLTSGKWVTNSIYTVIELAIAEHLAEGPKNVQELAKLTQSHEESLYRLMRMLAGLGIFREGENRVFFNTPTSDLLSKNHSKNLRSLILFYKDEIDSSWKNLSECIRKGKPAFDLTHGQTKNNYFRDRPKSAAQWNVAKKAKAKAVLFSCIKAFDFSRFKSIYDIGGGTGRFLTALLKKYPQMQGVLYELPEIISDAKKPIVNFERCNLIAGDFFKSIPPDGDAYILKSVLHDWTDKAALKILENCSQAMSPDARLIIIEPMITAANQKEFSKLMDVYTMVATGARERTQQEFNNLLNQAGFVIESITPTATEFYLIEARKKPAPHPRLS